MKVIKFLEDLIFLNKDTNIKKDDIYVVYDFSNNTVNYVELFKYEENPKHYINESGFVGVGYTVPYKLKKSTLKQLFNDNVIKEICEVGEKEEISTTIEQIKDKNKKITEEFIENEIMHDVVNILNCFAEVRERYKGDSYCFKNDKVISPNRIINIDIDYIKNHDKSLVVDKIIKELNKEIECFNKNTTKIVFNAPIVDDKDNLVIIQYGYSESIEIKDMEGFDTKFIIQTKDDIIANFISRPVNYRNEVLELEVIKNDETAKYIKEGMRTIIGDTFPRAYKITDIDEFSTRKDRFLVSFTKSCFRPEDDLENKIAKNN